ncbi:MAG: class I SAM-dependent methyltransferase [Pseudomonadota bacterium]
MQTYNDKDTLYFGHVRREVAPALPQRCGRVLELGCGAGATLGWLRQRPGTTHTTGIEIFPDAAQRAREMADEVHCLDFERQALPAPDATFDTILCLDVLEHMVDPWRVVHRLVTQHLAPGGTLVVTVPNIRHHTVVLPLLLRGRWQYEEAGILDRTHLRFFSQHSAIALLAHPKLTAASCTPLSFAENRLKRIINRATFRWFEGLVTPQYLLSARKFPNAAD